MKWPEKTIERLPRAKSNRTFGITSRLCTTAHHIIPDGSLTEINSKPLANL
jgi:hypothetical protein